MPGNPHDISSANLKSMIAAAREQAAASKRRIGPSDFIPGYQLRREIHRGGQGVVYLAHQQATQRDVAVKVLRQGPFTGVAEHHRFEREVQILASLKHPNIVAIHDSGTAAGCFFFVMDYIDGEPFDRWSDQMRLDGEETSTNPHRRVAPSAVEPILAAFLKVCDAITVAHQRGIIHRDLKPGNIRVGSGNEPFVLDFGLAKAVSPDADTNEVLTTAGQFVGTLAWASPEQVSGEFVHADVRSDVYALGLVLYRALSGQMPYSAGHNAADLIRAITSDEPLTLSPSVKIDSDLETIVRRCLDKVPERRYQTTRELATDLQRYLRSEPIEAKRDSAWYVMRLVARRHRFAVASAATCLLFLIGSSIALGYLYQRASANAALARKRANEKQQIAQFQAAQFVGIDPNYMGARLRQHLLDDMRRHAQITATDESAIPTLVEKKAQMLAGISFTDVAVQMMDDIVFSRAMESIEGQFPDQPLVRAELLQNLARAMTELRLLDGAEQPQSEALRIRQQMLGPEDPRTLASMHERGCLLHLQGKVVEAIDLLEATTQVRRRVLGDRDIETLRSVHALGHVWFVQESSSEAQRCFQEVLAARRELLGDDHAETLDAVKAMGMLLSQQGLWNDAFPYLEEAMHGFRRLLGAEHPMTLSALNDYAFVLKAVGRADEAVGHYREALELRRRVLGNENPMTLNSMTNLANLLQNQLEFEESLRLHREALDSYRRTLGDEHRETLRSMSGLGALLTNLGDWDEARVILEAASEGSCRALGPAHSETLRALSRLGTVLRNSGRPDEALPYDQRALDASREVHGDDHLLTLNALMQFGRTTKETGALEAALPYYEEALAGFQSQLGPSHAYTVEATLEMGTLLKDLGKLERSLVYHRDSLDGFRTALGENHPNTVTAMVRTGLLLQEMQRWDEAHQYLVQGQAGYRDFFNDEHPYFIQATNLLGQLEIDRGNLDAAGEYFRLAFDTSRRSLGDDHTETIRSVGNLANHHLAEQRFQAAEDLLLSFADEGEPSPADQPRLQLRECLVRLYERWHAAEPEAGHDDKADRWRPPEHHTVDEVGNR